MLFYFLFILFFANRSFSAVFVLIAKYL